MADTTAWEKTLSFSDRFSVINKIATALTSHHAVESSEAMRAAQAVENDCLTRALSYDEYIIFWKSELSGIGRASHSQDVCSGTHSPQSTDGPDLGDEKSSPLGPYTRLKYYADGANSTVYKSAIPPKHCNFPTPSEHPTPAGLPVALKVTVPSSFAAPHNAYHEATILRSILPHRNIIPLLETFTTPSTSSRSGYFILAFPFLPHSLASLPPLPSGELHIPFIKRILRETISALAHVHKHGIIHRDIKPSNILFSHPNHTSPAYLADFGTAWSQPTHGHTTEPLEKKVIDIGTTHYRPIETLFGNTEYGAELDLWSLGCVVAECFLNQVGCEMEERVSFFDSGDLGSELRLISSIFQKLGTPTDESWPGSAKLPDWGKIGFVEYARKSWEELLPDVPESARDLVDRLLRYEASDRITAIEALNHPLFKS